MKAEKTRHYLKFLTVILVVVLLLSNFLPNFMYGGDKAYAETITQTIEDFYDISDWTNNNASISKSMVVSVNTGYVKIGNVKGYGSVDKTVMYDLDQYPTITLNVARLDADTKWAIKVTDTEDNYNDKVLEGDSTKTGQQIYNLKDITGWSGTKTFKIRLYVIAAQGSGKGAEFSMISISGSQRLETELIAKDSSWNYLDTGVDQGMAWTVAEFDDSAWKTAPAPLGYAKEGKGLDLNTWIEYGPDASNKYPTTYFRKEFQVTDAAAVKQLAATVIRDDGAVIYLNGQEVYRSNIPDGAVTYNTFATQAVVDDRVGYTFNINSSLLVNGTNVLAAEVHQDSKTSSDLFFSLELLGSNKSLYSPISIVMSLYGNAQTSRSFTWYTKYDDPNLASPDASDSIAEVVEASKDFDSVDVKIFTGTSQNLNNLELDDSNTGSFISHKVVVNGLEPGTAYKYRVGSEGNWSGIGTFTTEAVNENTYDFLYMTDSQGANTEDYKTWGDTLRQSLVKFPNAKFLVMPGDLVDTGNYEGQWLEYFNQAQEQLMNLPLMPAIGNHDLRGSSNSFTYHFNLPDTLKTDPWPAQSVYAFDYGPAHFMVMNTGDILWDSEQTESFRKQIEWLREEAMATEKKWKILVFHKAIYSVGNHSTDNDIHQLKGLLYPVIDELGIDVVLQGHDHTFMRSYQMLNNKPVTNIDMDSNGNVLNPEGTLYMIANSSGRKYYDVKSDAQLNKYFAYKYSQPYKPMYAGIRMTENSFTIESYISGEDQPFDTYTIVRTDNNTFKTDKKIYTIGQTMKVSFKGVGASDQIGILKDDGQEPSEQNLVDVKPTGGNPDGSINFSLGWAPDKYRAVLLKNGGLEIAATASFKIAEPVAPAAAVLTGAVSDKHQLSGNLIITAPSTNMDEYALYWGDQNGKLSGSQPFAIIPADSWSVDFALDKVPVASGALKILVYSRLNGFESSAYASDFLPAAGVKALELEDFADISDWTDLGGATISKSSSGAKITVNTGKSFGYSGKPVTINVTDLPILRIKVEEMDSGAEWALKLNTESGKSTGDISLQSDTNKTDVLTYDLRQITGWSGQHTFFIKLFAVGGAGKSVTFSELSQRPAVELNDEPDTTPVIPVLELDSTDKTKILITNYDDDYADEEALYGELQFQVATGETAGDWTKYDSATGISGEPVTAYSIKVRYGGNTSTNPSSESQPATITTGKLNRNSPAQAAISSQSEDTGAIALTVAPVENGEYAIVPKDAALKSGDWKASNDFRGLTPGADYDVYVRYKETDTIYASSASPKLTIRTIKFTQVPPTIEYTRTGDWETEGVTVTITSPATGATYSTDNLVYNASNTISFPAGTTSAAIYVKLDETATQNQSAAAKIEIDFSKQAQSVPSVTLDAVSDENTVTLTISVSGGQTGSYEYKIGNASAYTDVPADGKIAGLVPGETITLKVRSKGDSSYSPSQDTISSITLPKYKNSATVAMTEANFSVTETSIAMTTAPVVTSGGAIEYSFDGSPYVLLDTEDLPVFSGLEPGSSHTVSVRATGDETREEGTATSVTLVTATRQSVSADITAVVSPSGAQISGTNISANVSNGTSSLVINLNISEKATWKLYSDSACITEITDKTLNLSVGANTAYVKVTAENGTEKVYTITVTRASAGNIGGGDSSTPGNASTVSDVTGATIAPQTAVSNGTTTAKLSDASVKKALKNISKEKGVPAEVVLEVPVKTGTDTVAVTLSKTAINDIVKSGDTALTLKAGDVVLTFSKPVIGTINKNASGDIVISAGKADTAKLTAEQKKEVKDRPVYSFAVVTGDVTQTNFDGNVKVSLPYTLKQGENPNAVIIYYLDEKGNLQVVENGVYDLVSEKVTFSTSHFSVYMIGYNPVGFKDVTSHWGKAAIDFAASRGLVKGMGNGLYQPDRQVTRAEFVQMIQAVLKVPAKAETEKYADVIPGKWYYNAIMSMKSAGLLEGIELDGNNFKPNQTITREEMAVILANAAIYKKLNISSGDLDLSSKFKDYKTIRGDYMEEIQAVVKLGLMNGVGGGRFEPKGTATRAQAAQVQMNLLKILN